MITETVRFKCREEIQMKAVAALIQRTSSFRCSIYLRRGDRRANGKSLLGVMSLGIEDGMHLQVTAEGADEAEAVVAICAFLCDPEAMLNLA